MECIAEGEVSCCVTFKRRSVYGAIHTSVFSVQVVRPFMFTGVPSSALRVVTCHDAWWWPTTNRVVPMWNILVGTMGSWRFQVIFLVDVSRAT